MFKMFSRLSLLLILSLFAAAVAVQAMPSPTMIDVKAGITVLNGPHQLVIAIDITKTDWEKQIVNQLTLEWQNLPLGQNDQYRLFASHQFTLAEWLAIAGKLGGQYNGHVAIPAGEVTVTITPFQSLKVLAIGGSALYRNSYKPEYIVQAGAQVKF